MSKSSLVQRTLSGLVFIVVMVGCLLLPYGVLALTLLLAYSLSFEFRFMLNYRFDSESPMALVLVGQTELWDKLKLQRYAAVRQRIAVNCVLRNLDRSETEEYIRSHLRYAGGREDLFTDIATDVIQQGSSGIPRMINRICEKSLMYASQQGKRLIDEHTVTFVMEHEMLGNV